MSFSESLEDIVQENSSHLLGKHPSWERVRLGDIAEILNGFPFASELFSSAGPGTPLIRIRDILRNATETFFCGVYPSEYMVQRGSLLLGMDGDFNSAAWRGEPGLLNQRCCKVTVVSTGYDERFLTRCLPGYLAAINAQTSAITVKHLSSRTVSDIPLPLPPLKEQHRIADTLDELLSDLEAGEAALERARAKLKLYRASVLKAAVEGALTAEWREQHPTTEPASALLTRILAERRLRWEDAQLRKFKEAGKSPPKDWKAKYRKPAAPETSNLPALPDGWCWATIDQITELITKGTSPGWQGFQYAVSGVPFIRSQNIRWGCLDLSSVEHLPLEFNESHAGSVIHENDVLLSLVGASIGRCAVATKDIHGANLNQAVGIIRLVQPQNMSRWMVIYVISSHGQQHIHANKAEVARANFNLDDIRPMPVRLPPFAEQDAISEMIEDQLSIIDHLESDLEAKLRSAQALRQSILRHAFEGKLVPQDPDDEPATELLKRIAAERDERARLAKTAKQTKGRPKTARQRAAKP